MRPLSRTPRRRTGNFQDELRLYMVFEYVPGGEVFLHLRNKGRRVVVSGVASALFARSRTVVSLRSVRFDPDLSKFYIAEVVLAFEYLHGMHIAYRDLKPEVRAHRAATTARARMFAA